MKKIMVLMFAVLLGSFAVVCMAGCEKSEEGKKDAAKASKAAEEAAQEETRRASEAARKANVR